MRSRLASKMGADGKPAAGRTRCVATKVISAPTSPLARRWPVSKTAMDATPSWRNGSAVAALGETSPVLVFIPIPCFRTARPGRPFAFAASSGSD